jgi:hypothetical protein
MDLRTAQKLASWASRYGKICRVMRPLCGALNRLIAGRSSAHALFVVSAEAKIAIKCWQAMLCLVRYQEPRFTRTLESFSHTFPLTIAEFDASLAGAGLIWYQRMNGAEVAVGVCAVDISFLNFGSDSSYQNLSEFIGAILAVFGHVFMGNKGKSLALRGDSVTALTWAITERPRGSIVTNAAMIWTLLCVAADVDIREITHIPGELNDRCDQLSRRDADTGMSVSEHAEVLGIVSVNELNLENNIDVMALLRLCDPAIGIDSDDEFKIFWITARSHIDAILNALSSASTCLPQSSIQPSKEDLKVTT